MEIESSQTTVLSLPYEWAGITDVGRERQDNEDTFVIEPEIGLFLVADGMGGHRGGALASKIVGEDLSALVEIRLHKLKIGTPRAVRHLLKKTIMEQSRQVRLEGHSETGYKDMGTTLVMSLLWKERAYLANIGDSRFYRLRNGRLAQLSRDHSVISELLDKGKIEPEQVEGHEAEGQITRYMGMEEKARPYVRSFTLIKGDRLLLCSDGLTDMVDEGHIAELLRQHTDLHTACQALIGAANQAGGHDNITVVTIDWK